jgi:solute carrier family 25 S-adenosylmethionine transporter 26
VLRNAAATRGGVLGLWHGWLAACAGSSLSSGVFFGAYETAKAIGAPPPMATLLGNALSSLVLVPKEVVKSRLQAGAPGSTLHVFTAALRERGVRGLYAGYMSTLLRNAPSNVISFSTFEALKHAQLRVQNAGDDCALSPAASLATGAIAGALAATFTHPLDLVKTRLMTQGVRGASGADLYRGVASTLRTVVRDEGIKGLGRGLRVRLFYNVLFTSLGLTCFEHFKRAIRDETARRKGRRRDIK